MFFQKKKEIPVRLTDEQLMALVCKGGRHAFEMLYDRYFNKLVWFARSFTMDEKQAEDLVQDVFVKIIESPERFDRDKKFSTWVYVVTANLCKQTIRNHKNRSRILETVVAPSASSYAESAARPDNSLLKETIRKVYHDLNEKEKNIYTLRFEQDLAIKEIATIINIPEGSVKSGIFYLLKKFAPHLKEFKHDA